MPFDWHVYLSETGAETSPVNLFEHVGHSLQPLIKKGQTLEAVSRHFVDDSDAADLDWWPAEVVCISGFLILFKWCIPSDAQQINASNDSCSKELQSGDSNGFWFDVRGSNWHLLRPIGTSNNGAFVWTSPVHFDPTINALRISPNDPWLFNLKQHAVPEIFFQQRVLYMFETIRSGGYFECEHEHNPDHVWPAKVLMNVGGRLKLSWFGIDDKRLDRKSYAKSWFTLFYLHRRIHPLGWGKHYGLTYCPPPDLSPDRTISNVDAFIRGARSALSFHPADEYPFDPRKIRIGHPLYRRDPPLHEFKAGWKLEAVNPQKPFVIQPATVSKVFNGRYFLVEMDDLTAEPKSESLDEVARNRICFVSHAGMAEIMPVNSSQVHGLNLIPPPGWSPQRTFTWTNYLLSLSDQPNSFIHANQNGIAPCQDNNPEPPSNHVQTPTTHQNSEPVHSPSILSTAQSSTALPVSSLYCPTEMTFKGIQIADITSPSGDAERHPGNTLSQNRINSQESSTGTSHGRSANPSNSRFLLGMKLEMVIPEIYLSDDCSLWCDVGPKLCTATVTRVEGPHMLWLLPDLQESACNMPIFPVIVDSRSTTLFPVGWASSCGHPLLAPQGYDECTVDARTGIPNQVDQGLPTWNVPVTPTHDLQIQRITYAMEEICPPLYINTKCYLGPFLSRTSLDTLPRCFGPGPTARVMHNLLTRLVSAAYRPIRVLRMFEADWVTGMASALTNLHSAQHTSGTHREGILVTRPRGNLQTARDNLVNAESELIEQRRTGMRVVILRIRCPRRGVKVDAPVEVCYRARAVEEFCRQISLVLEACPYLISTRCLDRQSGNGINLTEDPSIRSNPNTDGIKELAIHYVCPSFCTSRLRSRNVERPPGWKRKMHGALHPSGTEASGHPRSGGVHSSNLRTRSAVAAAQRQQYGPSRQLSPLHHSMNNNGLPSSKRPGRVSKRLRASSVRRPIGQSLRESLCHPHQENAVNGMRSDVNENYNLATKIPRSLEHEHPVHAVGLPSTHFRNHNLWLNYHHPYLNSSLYRSHHFRSNRCTGAAQSHSFQESGLNSILCDIPRVRLSSNPLFWSPVDLASYLGETDCREMWPWLAAEAVDGQAFMLLTLPVLHHLVGLQWEDAVRLARHVASVKQAFVEQFSGASHDDRPRCPHTA